MSKSYGKKTVISITSAGFTCLMLLLVVAQHQRVQVDEVPNQREMGTRSLQSMDTLATDGVKAVQQPVNTEAQAKKGFSAYFSKLTRGRREADKPAGSAQSATDASPAEDISADDIFIAVKTTKKFHQSRLNLLLDTWISRNTQQVSQQYYIIIRRIWFILNPPWT